MKSSTYIPLIIIGALIVLIGSSIALVKLEALTVKSTETTHPAEFVLVNLIIASLAVITILTLWYIFITRPERQAMNKKQKDASYDTMSYIRSFAIAIVVVFAAIATCVIAACVIAATLRYVFS